MEISGVGVDIVDIDRIRKEIEKSGDHFLDRVFTEKEKDHCLAKNDPIRHFSGKYAAKEAVYKAAGIEWTNGLFWNEIEILNRENGRPYVNFRDQTMNIVKSNRIEKVKISVSLTEKNAISFAIALK